MNLEKLYSLYFNLLAVLQRWVCGTLLQVCIVWWGKLCVMGRLLTQEP